LPIWMPVTVLTFSRCMKNALITVRILHQKRLLP
jgi:hypothetical protein